MRKALVFVLLLAVALILMPATQAQTIPPGPPTSLPDYIGAPAKAHPTANNSVQKNPFLAPNSSSDSHSDSWRSDTTNVAGPLGRNLEVLSSTLAGAHQYHGDGDWLLSCENLAFDSHGRLIVDCAGVHEASVVMVDPDTLEVLTYYPLAITEGFVARRTEGPPAHVVHLQLPR